MDSVVQWISSSSGAADRIFVKISFWHLMVWAPAFFTGGWRRAGLLADHGGRRG